MAIAELVMRDDKRQHATSCLRSMLDSLQQDFRLINDWQICDSDVRNAFTVFSIRLFEVANPLLLASINN